MTYTLGVDFGGGAGKGTLLNANGEVAATATREYPTYRPKNGWAEIEPDDYLHAACEIIREILSQSGISPTDIAAVAISSASMTAACLDENDQPVRRAIFWSDGRGTLQSDRLRREHGDAIFEKTFTSVSNSRTITHLLWMKENEPENFSRIRRIMFMKDYVRYRLTGSFVTDYIDAMGSQLIDTPKGKWSEELAALCSIPLAALPELVRPTDIVGTISPEGARMTGLTEGTKVICGTTDTVMEVYANGAIRPGQMTLKLATAGRICLITEGPIPDRRLFNYQHVVPGLWYPGTGTKCCASSYRWYRDALCGEEMAKGAAENVDAYVLMDKMAETVEPGSNDLFFHPYLQGEATPYFDERLKGSFTGVSTFHTKAHFTRALLEGVAYSLRDSLDVMRLYAKPTEAVVIGGGAKSPLWRQIVSDVLGLKLVRTLDSDSSLGSAMLAGVACGLFSSFEDSVKTCVHYRGEPILPDGERKVVYDRGFGIYKQIHDALEPVYHSLSQS